ncbi:hypothetical protein LTR53_003140 [Teratosphaeriaceae sp. CCFEE 6253]|nr:hypothetical protein LTR53_003140 [Teratosphaeriaceae sp. CCFEE 6253]
MSGQDKAGQSYLSKLSPWSRSPVVPPSKGENGEPEALPQQRKGRDHVVKPRHRLSLRQYPCPPPRPCWYHAVDVPKRRPNPAAGETKEEKPAAQPRKYAAFSVKDSKAIEAAFQKTVGDDEAAEQISQEPPDGDISGHRSDGKPNLGLKDDSTAVKVPVNEDYLFDVDVRRRELGPAYWLGPVYDVRRGTWFYQEGSVQRPCDENLAAQLEEGYLKVKAWTLQSAQPAQTTQSASQSRSTSQTRARPTSWTPTGLKPPASTQLTPQVSSDSLRDRAAQQSVAAEDGQAEPLQNTYRLFGGHMNSVVTYQDNTTAWLLTDDLYSRMNYSVYQRFAGGGHFAGVKMTRGYVRPEPKVAEKDEKLEKATTSSDAAGKQSLHQDTEGTAEADAEEVEGHRPSVSETRRLDLTRHMSSLLENPASKDPERQDEELRKRDEREIEDDYKETEGEEQDREIEHLILVTHGIGQRLGLRIDSVNFVHDVNTFRKTLKSVYADSPDLRALNTELDTQHVNSRSLKHNRKESRKEHDLADAEVEDDEDFPSLDDITVEGVPAVRNLITDLALDILLYQSPAYKDHISRIVLEECNRIYALFVARNPAFHGKISLVGHSLGSAIMFDILCRQTSEAKEGIPPRKRRHQQLDFVVEEFYALGSPIGLFQMLKGRTIVAREPHEHERKRAMTTSTDDPMLDGPSTSSRKTGAPKAPSGSDIEKSRPLCRNMHNIFHPTDPISYRIEPLISPAMAALKPQPLPYTKRGIFGAPMGQGLTGIGTHISQSVSSMWSSMASSLLTRGLGYTGSEAGPVPTSQTSIGKSSGPLSMSHSAGTNVNAGAIPVAPLPAEGVEIAKVSDNVQDRLASDAVAKAGQHPPTLIDANLETLYGGYQKGRESVQSDAQTRDLGAGAVGSDEWHDAEDRARRLKREEEKVRRLNANGRVDYAIQEGVFDINLIAAIASHLSYWSDEDVAHYVISQLLSRHRVVRPRVASGVKGKAQDS